MKGLFKKLGVMSAGILLMLGFVMTPAEVANAGRDCDGNAVIYCGISSVSNMNKKLRNGTGKPHQSGKQLTKLFAHYGYTAGYKDGKILEGRVTKSNKVYVGNKLIAKNVYSMGRHRTAHSRRISWVNYPLYLRHPQYSFVSSSIPAYVVLNYDGTFRLAIIKSCGNIVPGTVRNRPAAERHRIRIVKFNDLNRDGRHQMNEPYLRGWSYRLTGNGIDRTVTTGNGGVYTTEPFAQGTYTAREIAQPGWAASTAMVQTARLTNSDITLYYGNYQIQEQPERASLRIIKYNDSNGNAVQDGAEVRLSGWQFRVTGPNFSAVVVTDTNGEAYLTNLNPGTYTVTEILEAGWVNTTGLTVVRTIAEGQIGTYVFGNRQTTPPPPPPGGGGDVTPLPTTGPGDMLAALFGSLALSGGTLSYVRSRRSLKKAITKS